MEPEFYVGYLDRAPPGLAAFARRAALGLLALAAVLAAALALAQPAFAPARFEFGEVREFVGTILTFPQPLLLVPRPGEGGDGPGLERLPAGASLYYLVAPGKHGAGEALAGLDGHRVRLAGTLIYRSDQTMIELDPASLADQGAAAGEAPAAQDLGEWTLDGEIVDSKCFLGVMNPGNLKPHRDCATRCISGGIPPLLLVRQPDGTARHLLLVGPQGEAIGERILDKIAEPLRITGRVQRLGDRLVLRADPATFRRL